MTRAFQDVTLSRSSTPGHDRDDPLSRSAREPESSIVREEALDVHQAGSAHSGEMKTSTPPTVSCRATASSRPPKLRGPRGHAYGRLRHPGRDNFFDTVDCRDRPPLLLIPDRPRRGSSPASRVSSIDPRTSPSPSQCGGAPIAGSSQMDLAAASVCSEGSRPAETSFNHAM